MAKRNPIPADINKRRFRFKIDVGNLRWNLRRMVIINKFCPQHMVALRYITESEIVEAAKMANIYDFIVSLPQGFKTVIGERGTRLSGGERQRIVLARALARNPSILVLDEATSALDQESEAAIKSMLAKLKGKVTVLIIAHRLSSVADVDELLVIDGGRVIERGAPDALLQDPRSYFYKMSQLGNVG